MVARHVYGLQGYVPPRIPMDIEPLVSLLSSYQPTDAREAEFVERMKRLLDGPGPFSRSSYDPGHFTASAFVLSPERDSLLLIFHAKLGLWLQPGGHVEPADVSVLDAARREVAEEVGLTELTAEPSPPALFDVDIHRIPARPKEPTHDHFDLRFLFVASTRAVRPNDEVKATQWVPLENVENVTTDRSVTRAVEKLRAGPLISLE